MMNTILPGGVFKTFGIIFNDVKEKYNSSAAMLSWIPSICIGLGLMSGEFRNLYVCLVTDVKPMYQLAVASRKACNQLYNCLFRVS